MRQFGVRELHQGRPFRPLGILRAPFRAPCARDFPPVMNLIFPLASCRSYGDGETWRYRDAGITTPAFGQWAGRQIRLLSLRLNFWPMVLAHHARKTCMTMNQGPLEPLASQAESV
jgi:hypothetical protein